MTEFNSVMSTFDPVIFNAFDRDKNEIYHTNVVLADLDRHVVCCLDAIPCAKQRHLIASKVAEAQKELIEISFDEMENFCGNVLCLANETNESVLLMSERARQSFKSTKWMEQYKHIASADLSTIESVGGGSARCMVAELF